MSDLVENHIVGFATKRLMFSGQIFEFRDKMADMANLLLLIRWLMACPCMLF